MSPRESTPTPWTWRLSNRASTFLPAVADADLGGLAVVFLLGDVEVAVLAAADVVGAADAGPLGEILAVRGEDLDALVRPRPTIWPAFRRQSCRPSLRRLPPAISSRTPAIRSCCRAPSEKRSTTTGVSATRDCAAYLNGGLRFQISLRPARRLSLCEPVTSDNCHESLNLFMIWRFRHPGS